MSQKSEGKKAVPREANPYSFKNFTSSKDSPSPPFPDVMGPTPTMAKDQPDIFATTEKKKPASSTKEENPFSFFKYVKEEGGKESPPTQSPPPFPGSAKQPSKPNSSSPISVSSSSSTTKGERSTHKTHHRNGSQPLPSAKDHDFDDDDEDDDDFDDDDTHHKPQTSTHLPAVDRDEADFSDDDDDAPIVAKAASSLPLPVPTPSPPTSGNSEAKIAELREEVQRQKSRADGADKRALAIERKFEAFREKEKKETAVLEKMVLDVEENLKLSTSRAVAAEANAARLQQELNKALAELQAERMSKVNGTTTPTPSDFGPYTLDNIADIHNRASIASNELKALSENARNAVQMLLASTSALERCSFSLKGLEKITEVGAAKGNPQGK